MLKLLLLYTIVLGALVLETEAQSGCHCVNQPSAIVRPSLCSKETYKIHTYGACWYPTGVTGICVVGGTEVEVWEIFYGPDRFYWIEAADLVSAPDSCAKYTGNCSNMSFVTRAEWGARDPVQETPIISPFSMFFVHHTAGSGCNTSETCEEEVRSIQNYHMDSNGWDDIGYHFLVGEDGRVYEGRGWLNRGAHARSHNEYSYGVSIMGNFMTWLPDQVALDQINHLIACGVALGHITPGHEVFGHRDGVCTACPGDVLYEHISTWPSFSTRELPLDC